MYFVQATDGGPVKIGFSDDIPARIRQLESRYKRPLALLAAMNGGKQEEAAIHARFADLRLGRTEQFQPAPELMEFIGRPLFVNASLVELMESNENPIVAVRCKSDWKDWLQRFASKERSTPTNLIDKALADLAAKLGFEEPPKR